MFTRHARYMYDAYIKNSQHLGTVSKRLVGGGGGDASEAADWGLGAEGGGKAA